MKGKRLGLALLLAGLLQGGQAYAQDLMGSITNANLMTNFHNASGMVSSTMADAVNQPEAPPTASTLAAPLRFEATPDRQTIARVHAEILATVAHDPAAHTAVQEALESGAMNREFQNLLRQSDLDPEDLADALTAYVLLMWLIVNEQLDGPSDPAAIHAARDQFSPLFRADPALQQLDSAQRAAEFERLASFSVLGIAAYMHHRNENDRESLRQLQDAINEGMRSSGGLDLRTLELTSTGLRPRG
jgi:hypothetical protein